MSEGHSPAVRSASETLSTAALSRVKDPATGRVRVEDYLAVLASITGEAALVASGVIDVEAAGLTPGSPIFGDPMNALLTGDQLDPAKAPATSVVGVLVGALVPETVPLEAFGELERIYRQVATGVGSVAWGMVPLSVPDDNCPAVLPIQVAFELRPAVETALGASGLPASGRHVLCALALANGLRLVGDAMDRQVAVTLSLEIAFGMAKMTPMSRAAFEAMAADGAASGPQVGPA